VVIVEVAKQGAKIIEVFPNKKPQIDLRRGEKD